jgi:hypothetical protein
LCTQVAIGIDRVFEKDYIRTNNKKAIKRNFTVIVIFWKKSKQL